MKRLIVISIQNRIGAVRVGYDRRAMRRFVVLGLAASLAACASRHAAPGVSRPASGYVSCVPYARAVSGIMLGGDARDWWGAAAGRYARDSRPAPGSVLAFPPHGAMRSGHLSVVTRVEDARRIRVAHANWASGRDKGQVAVDQLVVDVSSRNDWTLVRVWYPPINALGTTVWPARGFIHPQHPLAAADVAARASAAAASL